MIANASRRACRARWERPVRSMSSFVLHAPPSASLMERRYSETAVVRITGTMFECPRGRAGPVVESIKGVKWPLAFWHAIDALVGRARFCVGRVRRLFGAVTLATERTRSRRGDRAVGTCRRPRLRRALLLSLYGELATGSAERVFSGRLGWFALCSLINQLSARRRRTTSRPTIAARSSKSSETRLSTRLMPRAMRSLGNIVLPDARHFAPQTLDLFELGP